MIYENKGQKDSCKSVASLKGIFEKWLYNPLLKYMLPFTTWLKHKTEKKNYTFIQLNLFLITFTSHRSVYTHILRLILSLSFQTKKTWEKGLRCLKTDRY